MGINDIIKNSFLESFNSGTTNYLSMVIVMIVSLAFGLLICLIYSKFYRGVVYSRSFAITLVGMTALTSMVTLAISTNVVISLGMVGALSIVRFRTAVKEPLDLLYLFWAITTGIAVGAQMYVLSIVGMVVMFVMVFFFSSRSTAGHVYIIVIHAEPESFDMIKRAMGQTKYRIKSKTLRRDKMELALEVYATNKNMAFVQKIQETEGVDDVTAIQYDGEYHS